MADNLTLPGNHALHSTIARVLFELTRGEGFPLTDTIPSEKRRPRRPCEEPFRSEVVPGFLLSMIVYVMHSRSCGICELQADVGGIDGANGLAPAFKHHASCSVTRGAIVRAIEVMEQGGFIKKTEAVYQRPPVVSFATPNGGEIISSVLMYPRTIETPEGVKVESYPTDWQISARWPGEESAGLRVQNTLDGDATLGPIPGYVLLSPGLALAAEKSDQKADSILTVSPIELYLCNLLDNLERVGLTYAEPLKSDQYGKSNKFFVLEAESIPEQILRRFWHFKTTPERIRAELGEASSLDHFDEAFKRLHRLGVIVISPREIRPPEGDFLRPADGAIIRSRVFQEFREHPKTTTYTINEQGNGFTNDRETHHVYIKQKVWELEVVYPQDETNRDKPAAPMQGGAYEPVCIVHPSNGYTVDKVDCVRLDRVRLAELTRQPNQKSPTPPPAEDIKAIAAEAAKKTVEEMEAKGMATNNNGHPVGLSPDERSVLMALYANKHRTRTISDIMAHTGLSNKPIGEIIAYLITRGLAGRKSIKAGVSITDSGIKNAEEYLALPDHLRS